jgi:hypothetical protein
MHDEPSRSTNGDWTTDHQDRQVEQSVLLAVIDYTPPTSPSPNWSAA